MTSLEKKAILVITGLLMMSYLVQWIRPHVIRTDLYDYSMEDSLFKTHAADTQRIPNTGDTVWPAEGDPLPEGKKGRVNLNTAGMEELESLPRIGSSTARLIMEYRTKHGAFKTVDELKEVPRIGTKTLELLRPLVCVGDDSL